MHPEFTQAVDQKIALTTPTDFDGTPIDVWLGCFGALVVGFFVYSIIKMFKK